ncbi:MAG: UbiA family prenyltransferase [Bdellovibrionales bacterium]|nr:UbiA family prenyltransferase [Bdellovibrionales bacterium]
MLRPRPTLVLTFSAIMGFLVAESSLWSFQLLNFALLTAISAMGAFTLNHYMERSEDALMERTTTRPLALKILTPRQVLTLGLILLITPLPLLVYCCSLWSALLILLIGLIYLFGYTLLKPITPYSTILGAIPGALLPISGELAVHPIISPLTLWMSVVIFIWQIPHTLLIVLLRQNEFQAANGAQLPITAGPVPAYRQIVWYCTTLFVLTPLPFIFGYIQNQVIMITIMLLSLFVLLLARRVAINQQDLNYRHLFFYLTAYLPLLLSVTLLT